MYNFQIGYITKEKEELTAIGIAPDWNYVETLMHQFKKEKHTDIKLILFINLDDPIYNRH